METNSYFTIYNIVELKEKLFEVSREFQEMCRFVHKPPSKKDSIIKFFKWLEAAYEELLPRDTLSENAEEIQSVFGFKSPKRN